MRLRAFALFGLAILIALTAFPGQARAATYSVTGTEDTSRVAPASASHPTLAVQNIRGIAGEVVTVDVVFSNPTGSGFSGIAMDAVIEDPTIAEFVDVQLPDWIDPFFVDFLMDFFIAPDGFPTSSINLVVPDLLEQINGVVTNEVLATISLRLIDTERTKLLMDLSQLDDDFGENLVPVTEAPVSVTISVSVCALDLELRYINNALIMEFELGTAEPATGRIWLFVTGQIVPLWSDSVPVVVPPASFDVTIPLPSVGEVWLLAVLTTAEGALCFTFDSTDTGASSSAVPSASELQGIFPAPSFAPSNN